MRRRAFISVLGGTALVWARETLAQPATSGNRRIGVLWPGREPPGSPRMESFRERLSELGFVVGRNVSIELRYAERGLDQLAELATELIGLKVDVIVGFGDFVPRVVQRATRTIPIVAISDDVVGSGLIADLSHPGGNTTGLTILSPELSAKRLELLRELVPGLARVAALWDPTTGHSQVKMTTVAARSMGVKLQILEIRRSADLAGAFQSAARERAEALNVFSSPFLASLYRDVIRLAAMHRLPAIYQWKEHAEAGGLLSYGPSLAEMFRQTANIVVKVLNGAAPANTPVEQPRKFELILNLKTARNLGLDVPKSVLLRTDTIIR